MYQVFFLNTHIFSFFIYLFLGFDDALDAFGVHAIGGIVGGISTGFIATYSLSLTPLLTIPLILLFTSPVTHSLILSHSLTQVSLRQVKWLSHCPSALLPAYQ